jgi:ATP-binding cassette subfamily C (CFTR/MRP) protein 1
MAMTLPLTIFAMYCIQRIYLQTSRQLRILELEARSPVYSHYLETMDGLATIRAFQWQTTMIEKGDSRLDDSQRPYYTMFCIQRWLALVLDLTIAGLATIVIALATTLRYSTSQGLLGVSLNAILGWFFLILNFTDVEGCNQTIESFITGWIMLETSLGAISRLRDLEMEVFPEHESNPVTLPPPLWPHEGRIEIENLSASYE